MRKMMIILLTVAIMVVVGVEIAQSMGCFDCPHCGQMGWQIGKQKIGYAWVYIYRCGLGHVWQCAW